MEDSEVYRPDYVKVNGVKHEATKYRTTIALVYDAKYKSFRLCEFVEKVKDGDGPFIINARLICSVRREGYSDFRIKQHWSKDVEVTFSHEGGDRFGKALEDLGCEITAL